MSFFGNKNKSSTVRRSRYSQPQFKRRLEQARKYRRPILSGWSRFFVTCYRFVMTSWRGLLVMLCVLFLLGGLSFWRPALFVRHVEVSGASAVVNAEVATEVWQYLGGRYIVLPRGNIMFLSTHDVAEYITSVNRHVMRVVSINKKLLRTLTIEIAERVPAFSFTDGGNHFVVSNDGTVLPQNESSQTSGSLLSVVGTVPGTLPTVGADYVSGALLTTLVKIRDGFSARTALPAPLSVELVPVVAAISSADSLQETGAMATPASSALAPAVPLLPVAPQEVKVFVPADPARYISSFYVLMNVDEHTDKTLDMLKLLILAQPQPRLSQLVYVDMRFPGKAFICLKGASCAFETQRQGQGVGTQ